MKIYYFDNWLKENEGLYEDEIILELIKDDNFTDDDIFEEMAKLDEEFTQFCKQYNFKASWESQFTLKQVEVFIDKYRRNNSEKFKIIG